MQWKELLDFVDRREGDLDGLIAAHSRFVGSIRKMVSKFDRELDAPDSDDDATLNLCRLHKVVAQFTSFQDLIYDFIEKECNRRAELRKKVDQRTREGKWGLSDTDGSLNRLLTEDRDAMLPEFESRLQELEVSVQVTLACCGFTGGFAMLTCSFCRILKCWCPTL